MARQPRIHYPGALYHVMVKGNNGENVFLQEEHKRRYLNITTQYKAKLGFKLYAFCIMDNHAHLLIEVQSVPLSQIMQRIQLVYTQWFNNTYQRTGHIFQQRYKAILCNKHSYLLALIRYIHYNPVKANLKDGINYKWSSHVFYVGNVKGNLVDSHSVLKIFSNERQQALKGYLRFMSQDPEEINFTDIEEFQKTEPILIKRKEEEIRKLDIDEIIEQVCVNENVTIEEITQRTKIRKATDIRKAIVLLSMTHCSVTNKALAEKLNLPNSMISKIKSGTSKPTSYVAEIMQRWEQKQWEHKRQEQKR